MKKPELVWMCLWVVTAGILFYVAAADSVRRSRFDAAETLFRQAAAEQAELLDEVLDSYRDLSREQVAKRHRGYLRDGVFDRLDNLYDAQKAQIGCMIRSSVRSTARRLAGAVLLHMNLCRRLEAAEVPQSYATFQMGSRLFPPETLEPEE